MKRKKWYAIALLTIILASILLAMNWKGNSKEGTQKAIPYKKYVVTRGDFSIAVSATGVVIPIDRVEIKSKASGLIVKMPVEQGDPVRAGDLLCRLDSTDTQAEVDQAQADLDIAEAEQKVARNSYERQIKLHEQGLLSDEELDKADLQLAQARGNLVRARIKLDQAKTRLQETIVLAPIAGTVLQKYVEVGQIIASGINNVSGGTTIADIADMSKVYVEAGIDEIDVGKIHVGQQADLVFEAYPQKSFTGTIIRISPEARVEQNVTLFDVIVEVENRDNLLKSGMNATAKISVANQDDVLLVPSAALRPSTDPNARPNDKVVLVKQGEEYVPRPIKIGMNNFNEAIVEDGLQKGDVVGVPMTSRLLEDEARMEQRIKSTRTFGSK